MYFLTPNKQNLRILIAAKVIVISNDVVTNTETIFSLIFLILECQYPYAYLRRLRTVYIETANSPAFTIILFVSFLSGFRSSSNFKCTLISCYHNIQQHQRCKYDIFRVITASNSLHSASGCEVTMSLAQLVRLRRLSWTGYVLRHIDLIVHDVLF